MLYSSWKSVNQFDNSLQKLKSRCTTLLIIHLDLMSSRQITSHLLLTVNLSLSFLCFVCAECEYVCGGVAGESKGQLFHRKVAIYFSGSVSSSSSVPTRFETDNKRFIAPSNNGWTDRFHECLSTLGHKAERLRSSSRIHLWAFFLGEKELLKGFLNIALECIERTKYREGLLFSSLKKTSMVVVRKIWLPYCSNGNFFCSFLRLKLSFCCFEKPSEDDEGIRKKL